MIRLRLVYPNAEERVVEVAGPAATIGRSADCDVVIPEPYISKQHTLLLHGWVAVDLGSSNGTLVAGRAIREPTVLPGREFALGQDGVLVHVEDDGGLLGGAEDFATLPAHAAAGLPAAGLPAAGAAAGPELAELRAQKNELEKEVARLTNQLAGGQAPAGPGPGALEKENAELRQRLSALKQELEGGVAADNEGLQARLASEQLRAAQEKNAALEARLAQLERGDAAPAPVPALPASDLFMQLQKQNLELREKVRELEQGALGGNAAQAGGLFFKLQQDNAALRKELEEARAGAGAPAAGITSEAAVRLQQEKKALESRLEGVQAEVARLQGELAARGSAPAGAAPAGAPRAPVPGRTGSAPPAPSAAPPPVPAVSTAGVAAQLQQLMDEDVEGKAAPQGASSVEYLVFEQVRFLRQVERVVTRIAGEFIQLYQLNTMLPDREGNFRGLAAEVLTTGPGDGSRVELSAYLDDLGKWLVAALGAHRQASVRFAEELRRDLSEDSLTEASTIGGFKKLTGKRASELWKRTSEYLRALTPDAVDDRLDKLAREAAHQIFEKA